MSGSRLVLLLEAAFIASISAQECPSQSPLAAVGGVSACQLEENDQMVVYAEKDKASCEKHDGCCWNGNMCVNEDSGTGKSASSETTPFKKPNAARSLSLIPPPPICAPGSIPFPLECKYARNEPYVTVPPVDVPYCVRIPCSLNRTKQKELDKSHFDCGTQPGCYFDVELSGYREAFGPAVIAGVPVCHMAIRRSVFHLEAQKVVSNPKLEPWNPYYTNCLLKTFDDEIREQPAGCKLVDMLKVFNIQPKLAGWDGITSYECILIDGCWRKTEGCFYPVDINNIVLKSNQRFQFNRFEVTYGRPKCQHFNSDSPYETLKSYHQCLASGCSVDADIASFYHSNLFEIGNQMTPRDHWEYWRQVEEGNIGSYNIEEGVYWNFDKTFSSGLKPTVPAPPKPNNQFAPPPPRPRGIGNSFGIPGLGLIGSSSGAQLPSRPAQEKIRCGVPFEQYGFRPCPPQKPPTHLRSKYCPYKSFVVPGYKPLKGSFCGCCEVNQCYLSRRDIRNMHSGPSFYYTEWTAFSHCSKTCGPGVQKRRRRCVTHDKSLCTEETEEEISCQDHACGSWGPWSQYPVCKRRNRLVTRTRLCVPEGAKCGINQETEKEQNKRCKRRGRGFG